MARFRHQVFVLTLVSLVSMLMVLNYRFWPLEDRLNQGRKEIALEHILSSHEMQGQGNPHSHSHYSSLSTPPLANSGPTGMHYNPIARMRSSVEDASITVQDPLTVPMDTKPLVGTENLPFHDILLPEEPIQISEKLEGFDMVSSVLENNTILIIPVNGGWHDLGFNLWCTLLKVTQRKRKNMLFLAFDQTAYNTLKSHGLPVYRDPGIKEQNSESKEWGSQGFNNIVCSKLSGVLHLLERGINVYLVDADVAFQSDPFLWVPPLEYDLTWSWGGHLNPTQQPTDARMKPPPPCGKDYTPGRCYVNTGFYYARATQKAIAFLKRAEKECFSGRPTILGDKDDQTYVNELLKQDEGHADYSTACFDPCRWVNGNTFFRYGIPTKWKKPAVSIHANFIKGGQTKIKRLEAAGLWDLSCINA